MVGILLMAPTFVVTTNNRGVPNLVQVGLLVEKLYSKATLILAIYISEMTRTVEVGNDVNHTLYSHKDSRVGQLLILFQLLCKALYCCYAVISATIALANNLRTCAVHICNRGVPSGGELVVWRNLLAAHLVHP